jgi:photosystem II stability/assembly factor-like uncharacterized protein
LLLLLFAATAAAQQEVEPAVDPIFFQEMKWRLIGPFRGGRVTTVTGVRGQPLTYYFGATGGGVWKTEDAGTTWKNVTDGHVGTGSVGAVAVAESDPNVVYAGMGEAQIRGVASSHGDGVYRSTDAGGTWHHLGLANTRQISRVRVHPEDPDLVYVAAQGSPWKANRERGVYRSRDGGRTWLRILYVDDHTGACDLAMDATNPRRLYAAFWDHRRLPWKIESGGPGSGLYKSTDAGDTWERLSEGLPELMGKVGVAVSPARPQRVWAIVEAEDGGLFRSDDGGETWRLVNRDRKLIARAWYYTKVFADPRDADTVWVANAPLLRSIDGGRSFTEVDTPHGDHHDLWMHPDDPRRMIDANDGGANVSWNGGASWSTQTNQPTGQFYRVITDRRYPYYVYGGQQDNSTVAIASRTPGRGIDREDWYPVGGCESAHIAFDPDDPAKVWAGCYQGLITVYDVATRHQRNVMATPYLGLGSAPGDLDLRFNWNAPIVASPHDPKVIFHAGNVVLRSADGGSSWTAISPDLTRDEDDKQGPGGGPITNEAAGGEVYNTIFYLVESPHEAGTLWAGTDDGLVHLTRDGGDSWQDVTPEGIEGALVNSIEVSPHDPASAYLAVTAYKLGDFTPHVFATTDYGETWRHLAAGIAEDAFVRVVREDPGRGGLLYAGTETGLYVSFDDGERWQPFQLDLPVVPITDLAITDGDLVAATQGRAFWILDDLTPLRQVNDLVKASDVHLFKPRDAVRFPSSSRREPPPAAGTNPPAGAILDYYLSEAMIERLETGPQADEGAEAEPGPKPVDESPRPPWDGEILLEILDEERDVIRAYSSREEELDPVDPPPQPAEYGFAEPQVLPKKAGHNRFVWDLRREQVASVPELFVLYPRAKTYRVAPGTYQARLTVAGESRVKTFRVLADPRRPASREAFAEQQALIAGIWQRVDGIHTAVGRLRRVRAQIEDLLARVEGRTGVDQLVIVGKALVKKIEAWEEPLVQTRQKTFQDVVNFPNRLNAQYLFLLDVVDSSDPPVTSGALRRFEELEAEWQDHEGEMLEILDLDVPSFNRLVAELRVPAVIVPSTP